MPTNRLASEQSPYLLQHQHNPVDWYPWGEEAFARARDEDRPIFLSIGYATCHWCHVMEHESFEDEAVAALMNDTFVSIKVDREERPDIDAIYMQVCQLMSGRCGWPLNVLLTPGGEPFYVTTYLPKTSRHGRMGMLDFVPRIAEVWANHREDVDTQAVELSEALRQAAATAPSTEPLDPSVVRTAFLQFEQRYDARYGGFGNAPKFPSPHNLLFLLRYGRQHGSEQAVDMVKHTLQAMRQGGLFDHVGFGFHRYATDAEWLVPHFEKMLYDQALLLMAYAEGYHARPEPILRQAATEIVTYVTRDLRHPDGAFFSAEDADSEGEEGKFYVWTIPELASVLSTEQLRLATRVFNLTHEGNFLEEATQRRTGANILHQTEALDVLAASVNLSPSRLASDLETIRKRLFDTRTERIRPLLDDKVLTDWNGLMIAALARAGRLLGEPSYTELAEQALAFVEANLEHTSGLWHRFRDGSAGITGMADDYAFMVWAYLEAHQTTQNASYLAKAVAHTEHLLTHFWDAERGGFYFTSDEGEALIVRTKEHYDGAIPSSNSVMYSNLLRLYQLTGVSRWATHAEALASFMAASVEQMPSAFCGFLLGVLREQAAVPEVVLVGENRPSLEPMLEAVRAICGPIADVLCKTPEQAESLADLAPFTATMQAKDGKATAYVCRDFACNAPTSDLEALKAILNESL